MPEPGSWLGTKIRKFVERHPDIELIKSSVEEGGVVKLFSFTDKSKVIYFVVHWNTLWHTYVTYVVNSLTSAEKLYKKEGGKN